MTEEKEAIEIIKSIININKENERTTAMLCVSDVDILLNLIEKLKKENEQLNNRDTSRLSEIGELRTKNNHLENEIKYYCIPKDKIRELIKEPTIITSDGDYISVKKVKKLLEED